MWIVLSLLAGALQVLRNALSRQLGSSVPPIWATLTRFGGNLPFTGTVLAVLTACVGWPALDGTFWRWVAATAACQSIANLCLVAAFAHIAFSRAVVLHKLEVAMAPFVGVLLFAEYPTALGWLGIGLCAAGTLLLNIVGRPGARWRDLVHFDRGSLLALGSATFVVLASFFLKRACEAFAAANAALPARDFAAAMHALVHAAWLQAAVLLAWIAWRRPELFALLRTHKARMARLGFAAAISSICWFWAYAIGMVAYVKAVGQIEVVIAALVSHWLLREAGVLRQVPAMLLVFAGILLVLLGGAH